MRFPETRSDVHTVLEDIAYTYWTDLTGGENEILSKFSKTVRYEIRRSMTDQINIAYYDSEKLRSNGCVLEDFKNTYMHFCDLCQNEDLKSVFDEKLIATYVKNGCFLLTVAEFDKGKVYHAYFFSDDSTCLWYSASDFRNEDVDRNLAARANKRLHFEDMKFFKAQGISCYDWGNVSTRNNENPNGIDNFKESFGGVYTEVYSYTVGNSLLGKGLVWGKRMLKH